MEDVVAVEDQEIGSHFSACCPQADEVVGDGEEGIVDDVYRHSLHMRTADLTVHGVEAEASYDGHPSDTDCGKADELVLEDGVRAEGQQTLGALGGIGPQAPAPTGGQDERVQADLS